ncbi:MAG: T9SS type A sorting domain-containing protein, partial [Bacteroidota bacterium]|nr:T9SS type A sorting domain-containing protein [Bacteroidota bacterium]
ASVPKSAFFIPPGINEKDNDVNDQLIVEIYPNPCSSVARLRLTNNDQRYLISDLYSISGKRIRELVNEVMPAGAHEVEIDVGDLPAGVYFIRFQTGQQVATKKLIVVRQ